MSRLLKLCHKFNDFYLNGYNTGECKPFIVEGYHVGLIRSDVLSLLSEYPEIFTTTADWVELNSEFKDYEERTHKVDKVLRELRTGKMLVALKNWRDEFYEVRSGDFSSEKLLRIDRCATCLFGIRNYSVSINGYVMHPSLGICVWLQQRAPTNITWPNKWGNMVRGGIPVNFEIGEAAEKETMKVTSVPNEIFKNIVSVGSVSFYFESERGLFPNTEFVFDLELPLDFTPSNVDGEIQKLALIPIAKCYDKMLSADFKTTSLPVLLDFMVRHGYISPDNEPNFTEILELLHIPLQSIYQKHQVTKRKKQIMEAQLARRTN